MAIKKMMVSQPLAGKTLEEITYARNEALEYANENGYMFVNTLFTDEWYSKEKMVGRGVECIPMCFLAKSIENMSLCTHVYFCKGWEASRGCAIEHVVATDYGLEIIYEA